MQRILATDPASLATTRVGSAFAAATAGGSGDATAVNGLSIDRAAIGMPPAAILAVLFAATLTASKTLSLSLLRVEQSADGATGWTTYETLDTPGVVLTATGEGQVAASVNLSSAKRYVRAVYTPDLSASSTDTATLLATWTFTGMRELPAAA